MKMKYMSRLKDIIVIATEREKKHLPDMIDLIRSWGWDVSPRVSDLEFAVHVDDLDDVIFFEEDFSSAKEELREAHGIKIR